MTDELIQATEDSARGSFVLAIGSFTSNVIYAIGVFVVAGLLGPELYGAYSLSSTIPAIFLLLVNLGVNQGLTKFSASLCAEGQKDKLSKLIHQGIIFNTIMGFSFFLICFFFSDQLATYVIARPEYGGYVRIASFVILFQALFNTANAIFVGFYKMEFNALISVIAAVVKVVVSVLLILIGLGVFGALTGIVVSYVVASVFGVFIVFAKISRKLDKRNDVSHFLANVKKLLKYGFPLYVATIVVGFYTQSQNVILGSFTSDADIGFFKAAQNFTMLIKVVSLSVATSIFPAFARLDGKLGELKEFFALCVKYTTVILLPIVLVIAVFSHEIILLFYGSAYAQATLYLTLIVLEFLLAGLGSIVIESFLNGIGETRLTFRINIVSFLIFLPLAGVMTKLYGVSGLIVSNLVAVLISTAYGALLAENKFGAKPDWNNIAKIYSASFASLVPVFIFGVFLQSNILLKIFLGPLIYIFLYFTLLPVLQIPSQQELADLERAVAKTKLLAIIMTPLFSYERFILDLLKRNRV